MCYKIMESNEIKELIKKGFDLELISFELDIPIEEVKQLKLELEAERKNNFTKQYDNGRTINNEIKNSNLKMEQIRIRYKKLFFKSNKIDTEQTINLKKQNDELVNSAILEIEKIEKILKNNEGHSKKEIKEMSKTINTELKRIEEYQLTAEQAEKLYYLINSKTLKEIDLGNNEKKYNYRMSRNRKIILRKLTEAIDLVQSQTEEVEELKKLERKLTFEIQKNNQILIGTVKSKIENKILKINQQKAIDKIRNDVPENVELIIKSLAKGTLDINKADQIIEKEAEKRIESKSKNKFALTKEQEKNQILMQIRTGLMEKSEQYNIENPEKTIMLMEELNNGKIELAVRTVVKNLINRKEFEKAKEVCKKFSSKDKESSLSIYIRDLKKEIRNNEIGDFVLRGINMKGTPEEKSKFIELIEKGIRQKNINLDAVPLGKSQDGLKNITLADIWTDEKERIR